MPVSNGMKMAVDEINTAGGIHGRKLKLVIEDSGYDPKKAVLATQKMIEKDQDLLEHRLDGLTHRSCGAGRRA